MTRANFPRLLAPASTLLAELLGARGAATQPACPVHAQADALEDEGRTPREHPCDADEIQHFERVYSLRRGVCVGGATREERGSGRRVAAWVAGEAVLRLSGRRAGWETHP